MAGVISRMHAYAEVKINAWDYRFMIKSVLTGLDFEKMRALLSLVNEQSQPNINALNNIVRNVELISLNVKALGYELARQMAGALPLPTNTVATVVGLRSKPSTQADIEAEWVAHWCGQLKVPVVYHRKLWELSYVLQAIYENGHMREGAMGLGFGCGVEPIPSYLASCGVTVTVTDLPAAEAHSRGWSETNQHAAAAEQCFHPELVTREQFDVRIGFRQVDMTAIPNDLTGYDFCWSVCALEHVGSIQRGMEFVEDSLNTLRPGGLAVHTTELNIDDHGPTIDNWPTVLFQRKHMETLAQRLRAQGHHVAELDFDFGDKPLDRFVDVPPWSHDMPTAMTEWLGEPLHLKVGIDGFVSTCFGMLIRKAG